MVTVFVLAVIIVGLDDQGLVSPGRHWRGVSHSDNLVVIKVISDSLIWRLGGHWSSCPHSCNIDRVESGIDSHGILGTPMGFGLFLYGSDADISFERKRGIRNDLLLHELLWSFVYGFIPFE